MAHATSNLNINWLESLQTCLPHGQQWKVSYYSVSLPLKKINILCFSFLIFFSVLCVCMRCPHRPEEGIRFHGFESDGYEPPSRYWESSLGHAEEQSVLLTIQLPL